MSLWILCFCTLHWNRHENFRSQRLTLEDVVYSVSISEMQSRLEFDIDSNGEVSEDEAKVCMRLLFGLLTYLSFIL